MLPRKIISASISSTLFAIFLGFIKPNPFGEQMVANQNFFYSATTIINIYLMYSFPVILLYGTITSIVSDKIAMTLAKNNGSKKRVIIFSGMLHIVFGLILFHFSLGAAVLFFITDKLLQKHKTNFHTLHLFMSLLLPITVWAISLSIVWLDHFINNS